MPTPAQGDTAAMTRRYELNNRARSQAETRQRIVEATVELHRTRGPAQTTISAIAQRAGVQRLTVYRHFPDERALFRACSGHWALMHPRPDPSAWLAVVDPAERLRLALHEIYAYYRATEQMTANVRRDLPRLPVLQEVAAPFAQHWENVRAALDRGWSVRGARRTRLRAATGHAMEFETWRSLTLSHGLTDTEATELMVRLALAARA